jgi:hypothetical protein
MVKEAYLLCHYIKVLDLDVCKNLTHLEFDQFNHLSLMMLKRVHSVCPNLVMLNVIRCGKVDDKAVDYCLEHFGKLNNLTLSGCVVPLDWSRAVKKPKLTIV